MALRHVVGAIAIVAATFVATRAVYPQDGAQNAGGAMPSEEEMWKLMAERAAPAEEHAKFASFVGAWDAEVTCSCAQTGDQKSKGTMTTESLLGGRVLLSRFKGDMSGQPFEGLELHGFDKEKKQHWSIWCDSFGTGFLRLVGERNKDGLVAMTSDEFDCMGAKCVGHTVTRVTDADHYEFDMVNTAPGTPESRMTIRYSRRK